ncbi:alpha-protein kinase 3 [Megalops cyprinoides]|uniref:alpha-protein kinase 3 n=1 Tax=Megalops cyprinoides TaxID=118141 RepID=UPI001863B7D0|nr:alpha-protein kinase 3 [Megalops cyprinoides]
MSSRRPLTRSFSGNGRSGSLNGEGVSVPSGRGDSRNYLLNVRPENSYSSVRLSHYKPARSAFCSVMSHLAEETQPSFETTLKSKAVSESSNVKFTCVVSGNPAPELTWYKDDVEMDRYCGLPKYEIFRNGKTHTLHIYNCTVEDAAIYQASARNSKGIVSCSGVLEVGAMNEYKIHQRFFAKLKLKADSKRKDLEQSRKRGKENARASPEQQRKRRSLGEPVLSTPSSQEGRGEQSPHAQLPEAETRLNPPEQPAAAANIPNGLPTETSRATNAEVHQEAEKEKSKPDRMYIRETVEIVTTKPATKDSLAKKMIKITSMVESEPGSSGAGPVPGKEKDGSDGAMSLTRYLTESLHSPTSSDQRSPAPSEETGPASARRAATESEEQTRELERSQTQEAPRKESEPPNALTSMFFSLRDMFFRNKNKNEDVAANSRDVVHNIAANLEEKELPIVQPVPHPDPSQTLQQDTSGAAEVPVQQRTPSPITELMDVDNVPPSVDVQAKMTPSPNTQPPECGEDSTVAEECMQTEANDATVIQDVARAQHKQDVHLLVPTGEHVTADAAEMVTLHNHRHSAPGKAAQNRSHTEELDESQTDPQKSDSLNTSEYHITPMVNLIQADVSVDIVEEKEVSRSDEELQTVMQQDQAKTSNETESKKISNERYRQSVASSTPVISVSFGDEGEFCKPEPELNSVRLTAGPMKASAALPKVPTFVIPPISVTCTESTPEHVQPSKDEVKGVESLVSLLRGVKNDIELESSCVSSSLAKERETSSNLPDTENRKDGKLSGSKENAIDVPVEIMIPKPVETPKTTLIISDPPLGKAPPPTTATEPVDEKRLKESRADTTDTFVNRLQKDNAGLESFSMTHPEMPAMSPTAMQRFGPRGVPGLEAPGLLVVPSIRVDSSPTGEDKVAEEGTGRDTPLASLSRESSPKLKRRDSLTLIPSATPEELASGARRKIFIPKTKGEEAEGEAGALEAQAKKEETPRRRSLSQSQEAPFLSPSQARRSSFLQPPTGQQTPPTERRSPLLSRKKSTLEVPKIQEKTLEEVESAKTESKPEKDKLDPFKAPRVIRKIRGEPFSDASGHLKLWCQFFNVLSDSTIKWHRDEVEIAEVHRSAGDESQVSLAIIQTSSRDCGVYGCSIKNEYGTDSTDFLLSADILSEFLLREELEVGEEIEMTPMLFTKGLADQGNWGNKLFGRIMIEESHVGEGCAHKASRVKVIYGLEPIFESGSTCIIKVRNPIAYGKKDENNLVERNQEITKQDCKVQNMIREYCKVFAAETRVVDNFGPALEVIPLYLMYRPANTIPYATVESDLKGVFLKYSLVDATGRLVMRTGSEVEQKCCTFQHWIHQWTNGNLLVTQLEGVDMKITNVGVATKSKGYQGLSDSATPKVFEQFVSQHQCNYYCGLLGLRTLKSTDSLQQPGKLKASRSPLLSRRAGPGSSSPQLQKKGLQSPQSPRKTNPSPKLARKSEATKNKTAEATKTVTK